MTVEKTNEEPARDGKECITNLLSYYDLHYSRAGDIGEMSQRFVMATKWSYSMVKSMADSMKENVWTK